MRLDYEVWGLTGELMAWAAISQRNRIIRIQWACKVVKPGSRKGQANCTDPGYHSI
jgi:hypothetical protein